MKLNRRNTLITMLIFFQILYVGKLFLGIDNTPSNIVEFGIKHKNGPIISTGKTIHPDSIEKGLILELGQDLNEPREYSILFFLDFQQTQVEYSSEKLNYIYTELESNDLKKYPFKLEVPYGTKELSILIIKKPDFMVAKNDIERAIKSEDVLCLRYSIASNIEKNYKISSIQQNRIATNMITRVFLSKESDKFKICTTLDSEEDVYVSLGNKTNEVANYAVIALKNWIQEPIEGENVHFFSVGKNEHINFVHKLPKTDEDINYQLVVFPNPFEVSDEDLSSTFAYATHRIHVVATE